MLSLRAMSNRASADVERVAGAPSCEFTTAAGTGWYPGYEVPGGSGLEADFTSDEIIVR